MAEQLSRLLSGYVSSFSSFAFWRLSWTPHTQHIRSPKKALGDSLSHGFVFKQHITMLSATT